MRGLPRILWWLAVAFLGLGIGLGGYKFVFSRAATLCLSCMGLQ